MTGTPDPTTEPTPTPEQIVEWATIAARGFLKTGGGDLRNYEDALSDACLAAWKAQTAWKPEAGMSRRNYTIMRARGAIIDGIRDRGHYSRSHVVQGMHKENGQALPAQYRPPLALEAILEDRAFDAPDPFGEHSIRATERRIVLVQLLALLTDRERHVLRLIYLDGIRQRAVAETLGVTESRVCQIRQKALRKLRAQVRDCEDEREGLLAA